METMIWFVMSVVFVIHGLVHYLRSKKFIRESVVLKGKIIELKKVVVDSRAGIVSFVPIIEFIDPNNGLKKEKESNSGYPKGKYSVGDSVEIRYYSNEYDSELEINNGFSKWTGIIFVMLGGISLMIGGLILLD